MKVYSCLQSLVDILVEIKKFTEEISQTKTLLNYILAKNTEKTFNELCNEFDSRINLFNCSMMVENRFRFDTLAEQLKDDQEDLIKVR